MERLAPELQDQCTLVIHWLFWSWWEANGVCIILNYSDGSVNRIRYFGYPIHWLKILILMRSQWGYYFQINSDGSVSRNRFFGNSVNRSTDFIDLDEKSVEDVDSDEYRLNPNSVFGFWEVPLSNGVECKFSKLIFPFFTSISGHFWRFFQSFAALWVSSGRNQKR